MEKMGKLYMRECQRELSNIFHNRLKVNILNLKVLVSWVMVSVRVGVS